MRPNIRNATLTVVLFLAATIAATMPSSVAGKLTGQPGAVEGAVAIYAPAPPYPASALARGARGAGIFVMRVKIKTGLVTGVGIARSTGHADLDLAAMRTLTEWRFKPQQRLRPIKDLFPRVKDSLAYEDALVRTPMTFR